MKRIVLVLALMAATFFNSFSQVPVSRIIVASQDPQTGMRALATDEMVVRSGFSDRHPIGLGLIAIEASDGWRYSLAISVAETVSRPIPEGSLLLVKLFTGEVLEFTNHLDDLTSQDFEGRLVEGSTIIIYNNRGSYSISMEDLVRIGRAGVQKIRIQHSTGYYDTEYKKDQWSKVITAHVTAIQGAIRQNKDIRSDF